MTGPLRVALVGVDGSGKSSVVARLAGRFAGSPDLATLHCPRYHDTPGAPFARLSRELQAVSDAADALRAPDVKAAILYLQMALYGPVERHLLRSHRPHCLVSDRHPVVDTLAYGPLYRRILEGGTRPGAWDAVRARLAMESPCALSAVEAWHHGHAARHGRDMALADLTRHVGGILDASPDTVTDDLVARYGTDAPDVVVLLDVEPSVASARVTGRDRGPSELHERAAARAALREFYERAIASFRCAHPGVAAHRLDTTALSVDETVDALLDHLPAAVLRRPRSERRRRHARPRALRAA